MFTKTKVALAATLIALTSTVALAQEFDPDLANRYPSYADPGTYGYTTNGDVATLLQPTSRAMPQSGSGRLNETPMNGAQFVPQYNRHIP